MQRIPESLRPGERLMQRFIEKHPAALAIVAAWRFNFPVVKAGSR